MAVIDQRQFRDRQCRLVAGTGVAAAGPDRRPKCGYRNASARRPGVHDRRRRRDDLKRPQAPIQSIWRWPCMTIARSANGMSLRTNQLPLMRAVPTRSENAETRIGYSTVVVQGDNPRGPRKPGRSPSQAAGLLGGDQAEGVGKGKVCFGIRVENRDAQPIVGIRRQNHRELIIPDPAQCPWTAATNRWSANAAISCRCAASTAASVCPSSPDGDRQRAGARLVQRRSRKARASGAAAFRAERQIEPRRIGAIDDVHVVISRQNDHPFGERDAAPTISRNSAHSVERPASVKSPVMRMRSSGSARCTASRRARTCPRRSLPRGPPRPLSMRKP